MSKNSLIDVGLSRVGRLALVRSHEERRWLFEVPTQSRISPSRLEFMKINPDHYTNSRVDMESPRGVMWLLYNIMLKHLKSINLVQENLVHIKIFFSDFKETCTNFDKCLHVKSFHNLDANFDKGWGNFYATNNSRLERRYPTPCCDFHSKYNRTLPTYRGTSLIRNRSPPRATIGP
jgi:hypothetical protein